jgi:hypothetical protein
MDHSWSASEARTEALGRNVVAWQREWMLLYEFRGRPYGAWFFGDIPWLVLEMELPPGVLM